MDTKYGFTKMSIAEFETWISNQQVARTILYLQHHHTFNPDYSSFDGNNHFDLQLAMRNYHVHSNGWIDIGQHITIFPDGQIVTGRSFENSPACIFGNNANAFCIENLGYFDTGKDQMEESQKTAIVRATAAICKRFAISINTDKIVYHHWFDLGTGERNNGVPSQGSSNKSCPGTNFFGGNKVSDCENNFLPLVSNIFSAIPGASVIKYVFVTAEFLNIRTGPSSSFAKAPDRIPVQQGAVLRVYQVQNNWYKISNSQEHWVYSRYTDEVKRATVNANTLNVRNGPSAQNTVVGSFLKGQEVFIFEESNAWSKVSLEAKWVKSSFLTPS